MEQMETEVSNYVHSCCRTNLKNIQETVSYIYRQMVLAAEDCRWNAVFPGMWGQMRKRRESKRPNGCWASAWS